MSESPSAKNTASKTTQPSASIHSFEPSQAARQLRAMLPNASAVTLFHRNDEGKREGIVTKPVADIAAAIHEARNLAGGNHVFAALTGLRLAFKDKASANAATDLPDPSYALNGPGGSIHLVYPMKPSDRLAALLGERRKRDTNDAYTDDDVPLGYGEYGLHADDLAALEALKADEGFKVGTVEEFEAFLSNVSDGEDEPESDADDVPEHWKGKVFGRFPAGVLEHPLAASNMHDQFKKKAFNVSADVRGFYNHIVDHKESKKKEGAGIVGAVLGPDIETGEPRRKIRNVIAVGYVGFDFDGGQTLEEAIARLLELGVTFAAYSSYNHLKDGETHKFRIVIPLKVAFDTSLYDNPERANAVWKASYEDFAEAMGFHCDPTAKDITRFFNSPRHPKGGTFFSHIYGGELFELPIVLPEARPIAKIAQKRASEGYRIAYDDSGEMYVAEGSGVEFFLSLIGDGEDQLRYHNPIWRTLCSYFANEGPDAEAGPVVQRLRQTIEKAERGKGREQSAIDRYMSEAYLTEQVGNAAAYIRKQREAEQEEDETVEGQEPGEGVENVLKLVEQVKSAFAASGKLNWQLLQMVADAVTKLGPDGVAVGNEAWDVLDEAINATNSKPKITKNKWNDLLKAAREKAKGREKKARTEDRKKAKSGGMSALDAAGWIEFSEDSQFFIAPYNGRPWVWRKGESDRPLCQHFSVTRVATAVGGKSQHLTIAFPSPEGSMSVTIPRGDLGSYAKIGEALLDAGFTCSDNTSVSGILMPLAFAANALLIDRTGFAYGGHAFLRPDGRTVRHEGREVPTAERPYLQSPGADRPAHLFTAGTREGYINAIRPAFVDAKGMTPKPAHGAFDPGPYPNVAFMALGAAAGAVHTYANPLDGVLLASIVAPSGSMKSIGAAVFVAGSGNPTTDESGFFTWDATKAGLEVRLPRLSACNLGLDELRSANDSKKVEAMLWMLFAGKGGVRSNSKLEEPKSRIFGGVCVLTSEELLADYFTRHDISPPPGFDARVVSIKYTRIMIPKQTDPEVLKIINGFGDGARANYGHVLEAAVGELLRMTADGETSPDALRKVLFGYRNELAAMVHDRQTMDDRAADLFATFRYSGELLQRLGFIPPDYDVKALVEWTWVNCRVAVRAANTGDALLNRFRATILANSERIPAWDKDEWYTNGADYRGALAWRSTKKITGQAKFNILMITEEKLAEIAKDLTGGVTDLIEALEKIGALIPGSDAKTHRKRGEIQLHHYQIDLDKLLKVAEGEVVDDFE
ncbi:DUF927 domain-containing protein [Mesorhizobium sp. M1272]|uniref:DUF927 domain-containing protein n=1 Tax=Mesorhizobium sp. M1272 TaxID=2957074 RepID=UPI003339769F